MSVTDTPTGYGRLSIALHWLGAIGMIALFVLGQRMEDLPRGPELLAARGLHVGVGMALFLVLALRVVWRLANGFKYKPAEPGLLDRVATVVHVGLLVVIVGLLVSGPLSIWANGRPIDVFGFVSLASPLPRIEWLHEAAEEGHEVLTTLLIPLVALHVLGALKHAVLDRDGTLKRMLVPAPR